MIDYLIFEKINNLAGKFPVFDTIAIFFAKYFDYFALFLVFLFLLINFKKYWPSISKAILAGILGRLVIAKAIRFIWDRPRPFMDNKVNQLLNHSPGASFPSGHAAFYFAFSTVIYSYNKKAGYLFFIASLLISFSRVFCGIHWPSDILGGAIVGIISGVIILKLLHKKS